MDWNALISGLLSALFVGGGLSLILFYKEDKRAKQLKNEKTAIEEWQELNEGLKRRIAELKETVVKKDEKIDELYRENTALRDRGDKLSSKVAVLSVFRCEEIGCGARRPPFGKPKAE